MKPLKIYHNINGSSIFSLDDVLIEPESVLSLSHPDLSYHPCPAWSHKAKRTFVVRSPVDLEFRLNKYKVIVEPKEFEKYLDLPQGWNLEHNETVQLGEIVFWLFWTDEKDVWIHSQPNLSTVKNNFYSVEAWFNISSWNRPISFAFRVIDPTKPVIIKRGDPLYSVSFYTKDLNRNVVLKRTTIPEQLYRDVQKRMNIRAIPSLKSLVNKLMFKNTVDKESKCPFHFLWNKK